MDGPEVHPCHRGRPGYPRYSPRSILVLDYRHVLGILKLCQLGKKTLQFFDEWIGIHTYKVVLCGNPAAIGRGNCFSAGTEPRQKEVLLSRSTVRFDWIAKHPSMGHPGSGSRRVGNVKHDPKLSFRTVENVTIRPKT